MSDETTPPAGWTLLKRFTAARIALGRAGGSLPTGAALDLARAHAAARDAVHLPFDPALVTAPLTEAGHTWLEVASQATDRGTYLRRPDLGRRLDAPSQERLRAAGANYDAVFVVADGLSALAVHRHAVAVLQLAYGALQERGWQIAPIVIARGARVALGDEIGQLLGAQQVAMLIGERPGLSAADSLGIYLTYAPVHGRTDAQRNCISNIRPGGLTYTRAAHTLVYLMLEAQRLKLTGVQLKDGSDRVASLVAPSGATGGAGVRLPR